MVLINIGDMIPEQRKGGNSAKILLLKMKNVKDSYWITCRYIYNNNVIIIKNLFITLTRLQANTEVTTN